nr:hypothetical protein [Tanacetum cinerariifolium]
MEEYMTKTQKDYGSGIARPKIDEKAHFELKGQFPKELWTILLVDRIMKMPMNRLKRTSTRTSNIETSDGLAVIQAQLNNLGREIKKVTEKVYVAQIFYLQRKKTQGVLPYIVICFEKASADLGASVSVMPLTTFTNLGLGDLAPTKLTVELADRTLKLPNGIAENVLVGIVVENVDAYRDEDMRDVIVG